MSSWQNVCWPYLLKFPHGFVKVVTCIFRPLLNKPSYSLTKILNSDLSKSLHGFFKINTLTSLLTSHGFVKVLYFSSFAKQHQVWPRVQSLLKLLLRPKVVEWVKVLNALGPLCIWQYLVTSFETCSLFILYKYRIFVHFWDEICRALLWKCFRP